MSSVSHLCRNTGVCARSVLLFFPFFSLFEYFIDETNPVPLNSQTKQDRYLIPPLSCTQTYSSFSSSSQGPHMYLGKGGVLLLLTCVLSLQCSGSSQKCWRWRGSPYLYLPVSVSVTLTLSTIHLLFCLTFLLGQLILIFNCLFL